MLEYIPINHPETSRLKDIVKALLVSLAKYQDQKTGMWFEVLDKPLEDGNWVESSCTNLFIYSYAKAVRMGILSRKEYENLIERAYKGSINTLSFDSNGGIEINMICVGTCIEEGTYEYYISRPKITNDLHGAGAFILMCAEMNKYYNY